MTAAEVLAWPFTEGKTVIDGKFLIRDKLAIGGMGRIYSVEHLGLGKVCVLKLLQPELHPYATKTEPDARDLIRREARTLSMLAENSDSFVPVFDIGTVRVAHPINSSGPTKKHIELDLPYYVMELLDGCNFQNLVSTHRQDKSFMPWNIVLKLSAQAARALCIAHEKGIIHRDIKPNNIYLHRRIDRKPVVKFIDFGVSTRHGDPGVVGSSTRQYGAPELLTQSHPPAGAKDTKTSVLAIENRQSDIYPLALVIYELAALVGPFVAPRTCNSEEAGQFYAFAHIYKEPPLLSTHRPDAPPALVDLLNAALSKKPDERPTAEAIATALEALSGDDPGADAQISAMLSAIRTERKRSRGAGRAGNQALTARGAVASSPKSQVFLAHSVPAQENKTKPFGLAKVESIAPIAVAPVVIRDDEHRASDVASEARASDIPSDAGTRTTRRGPALVVDKRTTRRGPAVILNEPRDAPAVVLDRHLTRHVPALIVPPAFAVNDTVPDEAEPAFDEGVATDPMIHPALEGALADVEEIEVPVYSSMAGVFEGWVETEYRSSPFEAQERSSMGPRPSSASLLRNPVQRTLEREPAPTPAPLVVEPNRSSSSVPTPSSRRGAQKRARTRSSGALALLAMLGVGIAFLVTWAAWQLRPSRSTTTPRNEATRLDAGSVVVTKPVPSAANPAALAPAPSASAPPPRSPSRPRTPRPAQSTAPPTPTPSAQHDDEPPYSKWLVRLVGFHTPTFAESFLRCMASLPGVTVEGDCARRGDRAVRARAFPLGIIPEDFQESGDEAASDEILGLTRAIGFIERALRNLGHAIVIGCGLVVVILFFFLYDVRTALISVVAIPLSLVAATAVLAWRGVTLDTMTLAGLVIALGEVVDDAIIDVENIARRLALNAALAEPRSALSVVLDASLEVRSAVVYATLVVVLVFVPVYFMEGLSGAFFRPLAVAYVLAVSASLVVALVVTPALSLLLLPTRAARGTLGPLSRILHAAYAPIVTRAVKRPRLAGASLVAVLVLAGALLPFLGEAFLPDFHETDLLMHWVAKPGTSLEEMDRITVRASKELRAIPGVRNFGSHIGRAEVADEVVGQNFAELWISLDERADHQGSVARIQATVDGYPGLYRDVQTYLQERMKEVLSGASGSIVVRLYGANLETLRTKAADVGEALKDIDGIANLRVEPQVLVPQIEIALNASALQRFGLTAGDVRRAMGTLLQGTRVGEVYREDRVIDVVVWGDDVLRHDVTAIRELRIALPAPTSANGAFATSGTDVRLADLASVDVVAAPNVVQREAASRRIDVTCDARGRDLGAVARDVQRAVDRVPFPAGHHAELLGEHAARSKARTRLLGLATLSLLGIAIVLYADFRRARIVAFLIATLPFALVGGVAGVVLTGGVVSLGSMVGFVTVLGIAARNGIMLVSHFRHLETDEGVPFGEALIVRGAVERVVPILMTALATGLALVPLVISGDRPGNEIEHPMAVVILGGLVTSTALNLLLVPALYLRFGRSAAVAAGRGRDT